MNDIKKITELNKKIVQQIIKHSDLSVDDIRNNTLREIEDKQNIKAKQPRIYFKWEVGEKVGWQFHSYKFVTNEEYEKREQRLDRLLNL